MKITLEEAYNGGMKKFAHERYRICETCDGKGCEEIIPCTTCKGRGQITQTISIGRGFYQQVVQPCQKCEGQGRTMKNVCQTCLGQKLLLKKTFLEVSVDKGIPNEHDYVMIGEAHEAPGVMAGDLHVRFMVKPHEVFERKGADLFFEKKITLLEALTGFSFQVTHLDGRVLKVVTMPGEVIENGSTKMIRNQGMPFFKDEMGSGNLFVRFKVEFPKKGQLKAK